MPQHAAQMRAWSAGQKRFSLRVSQRVQFKYVGANGTYHIQVRLQLGVAILFVEKWWEGRGESFAKVKWVQPAPNHRSEASTMHRICNIFSQLLQLFSPVEFEFRRTKGAIKLHLLSDHDSYLLCFAVITVGKIHELKVARKLCWEAGTIVVFDRGCIDYQWFVELIRQEGYWVTRLKDDEIIWWWSGDRCRRGSRYWHTKSFPLMVGPRGRRGVFLSTYRQERRVSRGQGCLA